MNDEELREAIAAYEATIERARVDRDAAIVKAAAAGMRQVDIIRATGYSRETIRSILRNPRAA